MQNTDDRSVLIEQFDDDVVEANSAIFEHELNKLRRNRVISLTLPEELYDFQLVEVLGGGSGLSSDLHKSIYKLDCNDLEKLRPYSSEKELWDNLMELSDS